jgi:hypothetical protein
MGENPLLTKRKCILFQPDIPKYIDVSLLNCKLLDVSIGHWFFLSGPISLRLTNKRTAEALCTENNVAIPHV